MDHLPVPNESLRVIRIRYLGGKYDGGPLSSYLQRQGTIQDQFSQDCLCHWVPGQNEEFSWLGEPLDSLQRWFAIYAAPSVADQAVVEDACAFLNEVGALDYGSVVDHPSVADAIEYLRGAAIAAFERGKLLEELKLERWKYRLYDLSRFKSKMESTDQMPNLPSRAETLMSRLSITQRTYSTRSTVRSDGSEVPLPVVWVDEVDEDSKAFSLLRLMQTWLFFGLLNEMCVHFGVKFEAEDFIMREKSGTWLTTQRLPAYLRIWKTSDPPIDDPELARARSERSPAICDTLQFVTATVQPFERLHPANRIAASSLTFAVLHLSELLQKELAQFYRGGNVHQANSTFIRTLLIDDGWCPNQVVAMESSFSLAYLYCIYVLGPICASIVMRSARWLIAR